MVQPIAIVLLVLLAMALTTVLYPFLLGFALKHGFVDNPNYRKLQRKPIPVMGGAAVFSGILIAGIAAFFVFKDARFLLAEAAMLILFLIGIWDDRKDISPYARFLVEILVVWGVMFFMEIEIDDFHGLWGVYKIPEELSILMSLVAGVGIINAINLIDGVDGYCSSYGMMAFAVFGIAFVKAGDLAMATLCFIGIGSLLPFFFHNVFGRSSKMFLGDGGSLMMGTMLTICVFNLLSSKSQCVVLDWNGVSLPALVLAILAVPVFDTLRVMTARMVKMRSPFSPDKTHLHHLYIDLNFSHVATSLTIVFMNGLIVVLEYLMWMLGVSVTWQLYVVVAASLLYTCVFYYTLVREGRKNDGEGSSHYQAWCRLGEKTHLGQTRFWAILRHLADSTLLGGHYIGVARYARSRKNPRPDPRV